MIFTLDDKPNGIELLYYSGKYTEAYQFVQKALKSSKKNQPGFYKLLIWQIKLKPLVGKFSNILEEANEIIDVLKKKKKYKLLLEAILIKISILNIIGRIDETLKEINYGESLLESIEENKLKEYFKANLLVKKGEFYSNKYEHNTARSLFKEALKIYQKYNLLYRIASVENDIGGSYRKLDDKETAFKHLEKSLEISTKYNYKLLQANALTHIGNLYNQIGDLSKSLEYLQKSHEIHAEIGSPRDLGSTNLNLGVFHHFRGNYNQALKYYQKALGYFEIVGNETYISASHYNIGLIYNLLGKLNKSLEKYLQVLPIIQKLGNISLITACFNSLGKIYYDLGLYDKAENYLRTVYQLKENITKISISKALFYLIPILLKREAIDDSKQFIDYIESIKDENVLINQRYQIIKALYLSSFDNYSFKDIEKIYVQVINEPISDYETTVEAIIQLTQLLLKEYKKTRNTRHLERIKYYSKRLSKIATKQQSRLLFVEHYWLKSRIAFLEGNKKEASDLASQAREIAKEMNFKRMISKMDDT